MSDWSDSDPDRVSKTSPETAPDTASGSDSHRLGARVDRSQETYRPSPYAAQKSLPHGSVSKDGREARAETSLTSRVLCWGGVAVAAAAVTAGGVLAVRKVVDLVAGDDDDDRGDRRDKHDDRTPRTARRGPPRPKRRPEGSLAPRFADLSEEERARMRARQRARERDMDSHARDVRAHAAEERGGSQGDRPRRPSKSRPSQSGASKSRARSRSDNRSSKPGLLAELESTATRLSGRAESLVGTVGAALAGFRTVAGQADGVIREFSQTADQVRGFLNANGLFGGDDKQDGKRRDTDAYRKASRRDVVDLRDDAEHADEAGKSNETNSDNARTHRL